jgi:hypothetical protein
VSGCCGVAHHIPVPATMLGGEERLGGGGVDEAAGGAGKKMAVHFCTTSMLSERYATGTGRRMRIKYSAAVLHRISSECKVDGPRSALT